MRKQYYKEDKDLIFPTIFILLECKYCWLKSWVRRYKSVIQELRRQKQSYQPQSQGQSGLHSEFWATQGYISRCVSRKKIILPKFLTGILFKKLLDSVCFSIMAEFSTIPDMAVDVFMLFCIVFKHTVLSPDDLKSNISQLCNTFKSFLSCIIKYSSKISLCKNKQTQVLWHEVL